MIKLDFQFTSIIFKDTFGIVLNKAVITLLSYINCTFNVDHATLNINKTLGEVFL